MADVAPDVLLIVDDLEDSNALRLSREVVLSDQSVAVILLSDNTTPEFYQDVFQAGGKGVVALTPSPSGKNVASIEKLINAITRAYEYLTLSSPARSMRTQQGGDVWTVFSAKGGVGTTTLAVNLAAAAALVDPSKKVLFLDLNLQFGTSHTYLDLAGHSSVAEIAPMAENMTRQGLMDMIAKKDVARQSSLYVIPSPGNPRAGEIVMEGQVRSLLATARRYFDLVVVDTTSTISDVTLPALQEANERVLVCMLDVMSVSLLRSTMTMFDDPELNIPRGNAGILVNRIGAGQKEGLVKVSHLEELFNLPILGKIPDNPDWVETRLASSEFLVDGNWEQPFQQEVRQLLDSLAGQD